MHGFFYYIYLIKSNYKTKSVFYCKNEKNIVGSYVDSSYKQGLELIKVSNSSALKTIYLYMYISTSPIPGCSNCAAFSYIYKSIS